MRRNDDHDETPVWLMLRMMTIILIVEDNEKDDDEKDDDEKPVWPTWDVGVLSGVYDVETYNQYGVPSVWQGTTTQCHPYGFPLYGKAPQHYAINMGSLYMARDHNTMLSIWGPFIWQGTTTLCH